MIVDQGGTVLFVSGDAADYISLTPVSTRVCVCVCVCVCVRACVCACSTMLKNWCANKVGMSNKIVCEMKSGIVAQMTKTVYHVLKN